ncbi:MAG: UbiA family prenyltransferase [Candidatus Gastranaerophilales bacterium]|nr:UbiA family prenyltransferase [Candidatus Gastranaerophilales bacterium]
MFNFLIYYLKSMRLYYGFVTLTAGWVGISLFNGHVNSLNKEMLLLIMFIGWGVNQIINDYTGLKEDKINAPERPMVNGKLKPKPALILSVAIICSALGYSLYINPLSIIPLIFGVLMNIVYSWAKSYGIIGNLAFGVCIASCTWYCYVAVGGGLIAFFKDNLLIWICVITLNMIMTYFTYFKDYAGDKSAGKNTLVVKYGLKTASKIGLAISFIPVLLFVAIGVKGNIYYFISALISAIMFLLTGFLFFKKPEGENTYFNLKYNFAALSASQATIVCLTYGVEGLILSIISIVGVLTIFKLGYKDAKQ